MSEPEGDAPATTLPATTLPVTTLRAADTPGTDAEDLDLPFPIALAGPLVDATVAVVAELVPSQVPGGLRALAKFDARRLGSATARRQVLNALLADPELRSRVGVVCGVVAELDADRSIAESGSDLVADAAERGDLAVLAGALWGARPRGWAFAFGVLTEAVRTRAADQTAAETDAALRRQVGDLEVALGRARAESNQLTADAAALRTEAKDVRRALRQRDDEAARVRRVSDARIADLETTIARLESELAAARDVAAREVQRAADADRRRQAAEAESATLAAQMPGVTRDGLLALAATVADAAGRLERAASARSPEAQPTRSARVSKPRSRRVRPDLPPGLRADEPDAIAAMLRTSGSVLFVDGYNVAKLGWPHLSNSDQRSQLESALDRARSVWAADVIIVWDGDGPEQTESRRTSGLRVVFSERDEDADDVIVRLARRLPHDVAIVVASADRRVQDETEAIGAVAVSNGPFLTCCRAGSVAQSG